MKKFVQNICARVACLLIALSVCSCSCSGGKKSSKPRSYVEAVSANDYVTAHEILDEMLMRALQRNTTGFCNAEAELTRYWDAADHVYKSEMLYLIDLKDNEANRRLVNSLLLMNVIGDKPKGVVKEFNESFRCKNYSLFVTRYNRLCDEILDVSIVYNNGEMAKRILGLYKEDCSFVGDKTYASGDMDWFFKFSNDSKNAATKKYNDAIKNGLLN